MNSRKAAHHVWHVSRGIVFSGGSNAAYPRLPTGLARHHSSTAAATSEGSSAALPTVLTTTDVSGELSAGRGEGMLDNVIAAPTATRRTTTTTTSTATVVEGGAAGKDKGAATGATEKPEKKDIPDIAVPFTPLDYKIPHNVFQAARWAPEGTPGSYWNYSMYRGPGKDGEPDSKVKVHYCTSEPTTERVIKQYFMNEKVLGLDLEWVASARKSAGARQNVSLIQLASPTRIGLFHIAAFPKDGALVAPALKELLQNPEVTKVGVSIKGDCTRLSQFLQIETRGQFELSHLYKLVKYSESGEYASINKKLVALSMQVKEYLGLPIFKGDDVRISDWSRRLNMEQIMYSSSDAYAAVQLYAILNHYRQKLNPVPAIPHHAELNLPIPIAKPVVPKVSEKQKAGIDAVVKDEPVVQVQSVVTAETTLESTTADDQPDATNNPSPKPKTTRKRAAVAKAKLDIKSSVELNTTPSALAGLAQQAQEAANAG
ncbi:ribonuclease H-like domain-containing protein [Chaetomium sp. MPI-CAGE-AT-0009]|nr:ribonuclease H-like domain-containing protein [Chaetomium sp. MPI-CAGE-AT-0009]